MAKFEIAYAITKKHEGGYANNSNDNGGETYAGIARKFWGNHPEHSKIFVLVDNYKPLKWNQKINDPELNKLIANFYYKEFWIKQARGHEINNQDIANFIFDFTVNSGHAENQVDEAINKAITKSTGIKVNATNGRLDDKSIELLNRYPKEIYPYLIAERIDYVKGLADFVHFGKTWLSRIASYPAQITADVLSDKKKEQS